MYASSRYVDIAGNAQFPINFLAGISLFDVSRSAQALTISMLSFIDIFRAIVLCLYLAGATFCLFALAVIYFYFGRWLLHIPVDDDGDNAYDSHDSDQSYWYQPWHDAQGHSPWTTSSPWDESETSTFQNFGFADPVPRRQRSTPDHD